MQTPDEARALLARERLTSHCEALQRLLLGLLDSQGRVAEEIHAIRKMGKSLRGGLSLFRLEKSAALEIQVIGRLLSGPRDAVSRLNTWNKLGWAGEPKLGAAIFGLLDQQTHSAARRPPPETVAWCVDRVHAALEELQSLPAYDLPQRIAKGLAKLEKKTHTRCKKLTHRAEEDFHEARKAVKAWLGALVFLPQQDVTVEPILTELADWLGDENDLATLGAWLMSHGFTQRFAPDLWQALAASRDRLQSQVIEEAAHLQTAALA